MPGIFQVERSNFEGPDHRREVLGRDLTLEGRGGRRRQGELRPKRASFLLSQLRRDQDSPKRYDTRQESTPSGKKTRASSELLRAKASKEGRRTNEEDGNRVRLLH